MARVAKWFALVLVALGGAGCSTATTKEPISVAYLLPLTGPDRDLGRQARQAVQLAVEEINGEETGGILGRPLLVRNVDSRGEAEIAQGETVRLLSVQRCIAVVAPPDAAIAEQIVRTANPYPTTVIVPGELGDPPTGEGALCLGVNPRKRGQVLARFASQELKAKRAVVLTEKQKLEVKPAEKAANDAPTSDTVRPEHADPVARSVATGFLDEWPRSVPASAETWAVPDVGAEKDLPARLTDAKADVVVVCCSVNGFLKLHAQCAAAKFAAPLIYGGEDRGVRPLQDNLPAPDVYLATVLTADALTDKGKAFAKKYEERFHEPPDLTAVQAYDAVRLLAETMQRDSSTSGIDPRTALGRTDAKFESLAGTITWKDHLAKRPLFLVRLHEKESTVVKTIKADE